jgi:hypothetical protein
MSNRFSRQIALFGEEGQQKISQACVAIIGVGGLGTHLIQQLALLGVLTFFLVDDEKLSRTNTNRYVGVRFDDPIPGFPKVDLGERIAKEINPDIVVHKIADSFVSEAGFHAIQKATLVFGGLDLEGCRLVLNDVCTAYARSYIDLASDILTEGELEYGGRVCVCMNGDCCLQCLDVLDTKEASRDLEGEAERRNRDRLYGVDRQLLGRTGPSVVSINGIIASLAVTEFMAAVTGLRPPKGFLTYRGSTGKVTLSTDIHSDCLFCKGRWGKGHAIVKHYLTHGTADKLRQQKTPSEI